MRAYRTAKRRQRETTDRQYKQPAHAQCARQHAGQWNCDHLGDEIGGLHPTHLVRWDAECTLDDRQRRRDDLHVEDRHEHADAHRREAEPGAYHDAALSICQETNHAKSMDRKQSTARPGKVLTMEVGLGRFDRAKISVCISVHVWLPSFVAALAPKDKVQSHMNTDPYR